jgi:hypothetical protein
MLGDAKGRLERRILEEGQALNGLERVEERLRARNNLVPIEEPVAQPAPEPPRVSPMVFPVIVGVDAGVGVVVGVVPQLNDVLGYALEHQVDELILLSSLPPEIG